MLELVFVIVILGIVASLGSEIIAKVYQSYIIQRAIHRSTLKTELAALQIANRLAYVIPNTAIGRKTDGTFESLDNLSDNNYTILEWVGYDNDGLTLDNLPGWSGFVDVASSTKNNLVTPGSDIGRISAIMGNMDSTTTLASCAIFFPNTYTPQNIGYNGNASGVSRVSGKINATTFALQPLVTGTPRIIKEHYKLAKSAYALVPEVQPNNGLWTLNLHYNYQPWNGLQYDNSATKKVALIKNVSVFQFSGSENSIRFKICQQEWISDTSKITTCKEKAVIR